MDRLSKVEKEAMRKLGQRGGQKRAKTLSLEKRKEIARKAAKARWARKKTKR